MKKFFLFDNTESDTKVSNTRLLSHAAGLVGQNMAYSIVSSRLFVFLNTVLGIPAEKTGIIMDKFLHRPHPFHKSFLRCKSLFQQWNLEVQSSSDQ